METRNEDSVLPGQFVVDGFSVLHTLDRNCLAGGMLFVREDIPSNLLTIEEKKLESFYVELNLRNNKWLVNCSNNPHKNTQVFKGRTKVERILLSEKFSNR